MLKSSPVTSFAFLRPCRGKNNSTANCDFFSSTVRRTMDCPRLSRAGGLVPSLCRRRLQLWSQLWINWSNRGCHSMHWSKETLCTVANDAGLGLKKTIALWYELRHSILFPPLGMKTWSSSTGPLYKHIRRCSEPLLHSVQAAPLGLVQSCFQNT